MSRGDKLVVAMVGLPAAGKSTVALKLKENLEKEDVRVAVFNNGDVRGGCFGQHRPRRVLRP
jgi:adenylylsulfate kinase-like enzyme